MSLLNTGVCKTSFTPVSIMHTSVTRTREAPAPLTQNPLPGLPPAAFRKAPPEDASVSAGNSTAGLCTHLDMEPSTDPETKPLPLAESISADPGEARVSENIPDRRRQEQGAIAMQRARGRCCLDVDQGDGGVTTVTTNVVARPGGNGRPGA